VEEPKNKFFAPQTLQRISLDACSLPHFLPFVFWCCSQFSPLQLPLKLLLSQQLRLEANRVFFFLLLPLLILFHFLDFDFVSCPQLSKKGPNVLGIRNRLEAKRVLLLPLLIVSNFLDFDFVSCPNSQEKSQCSQNQAEMS